MYYVGKRLGYMILLSVVGILGACQSQPKPVKKVMYQNIPVQKIKPIALPVVKSLDGVQDVRWTLTQIKNRKALFFNQTPNLLLQSINQRILGHTGCNTLFGTYQLDVGKQTLQFKANAGHQACDSALAQEAELMDALARITSFTVQGNSMIFYDANKQVLLQAQR